LKLPESIRQKIAESNRAASESKPMTPLPTVPSDGISSRFTVRPFEDWTMREAAAVALSRIGEPAVPALVEALKSPDPNIRQQAADTLARIGPAAANAVPALTGLLEDPDPRVKKSAVRALGQIGPAAATAVPSLMRALE
jgi:HEAT repeat protein